MRKLLRILFHAYEGVGGHRALRFVSLLLPLTVAWLPIPAAAVPFDNMPKILLHLKGVTTRNACSTWGDLSDCMQATTHGTLSSPTGPFYYMYLLVATGPLRDSSLGGNGRGIAGLQFGVHYSGVAAPGPPGAPGVGDGGSDGIGVDVFGFNLCATLQFTLSDWPATGSGNLITWDPVNACQRGEVAIAGYFYCAAYSADTFTLTVRPVDRLAVVADCVPPFQEYQLTTRDLGRVSFSPSGLTAGCNPCIEGCLSTPISVESSTWSAIKGQFAPKLEN